MARQQIKHAGTGHTCGECARGEYSKKHCNRAADGHFFLKYCEFSRWARNRDGQHVCLECSAACENFKPLQKQ